MECLKGKIEKNFMEIDIDFNAIGKHVGALFNFKNNKKFIEIMIYKTKLKYFIIFSAILIIYNSSFYCLDITPKPLFILPML